MKIAIHGPTSDFSAVWSDYCQRSGIEHKLVDCRAPDILDQVADCDIVMWQHSHFRVSDKIAARAILNSIEQAGKIVAGVHDLEVVVTLQNPAYALPHEE